MKRLTQALLALAALLFSAQVHAQIHAIGAGGGMVMPSGSFSDYAGRGFGGGVRLHDQYEDLENLELTGSAGYYRFGSKEWNYLGLNTGVDIRYTVIPLTSGGRYYFGDAKAMLRP